MPPVSSEQLRSPADAFRASEITARLRRSDQQVTQEGAGDSYLGAKQFNFRVLCAVRRCSESEVLFAISDRE
jgi:hypothetical protein